MEKYHHTDERRDEVEADRHWMADDPKEENDDADEPADWGDVDPQHHPLSPPDPMDPSGPGSAV